MTNECDKSCQDVEIRLLKNRLKQRRYRARLREEKARRAAEERTVTRDFLISSTPNAVNELCTVRCDVQDATHDSAKNGFSSSRDFENCGTEKCEGEEKSDMESKDRKQNYWVQNDKMSSDRAVVDCHKIHAPKIIQTSAIGDDDFHMTSLSETDHIKSNDEVMARRRKNRERQRRYRARKRLEADMRNSNLINPLTLLQSEPRRPNGTSSIFETHVRCRRNWKRDARMAHAKPELEVESNSQHPANRTGRRDWKADARNKLGSCGSCLSD